MWLYYYLTPTNSPAHLHHVDQRYTYVHKCTSLVMYLCMYVYLRPEVKSALTLAVCLIYCMGRKKLCSLSDLLSFWTYPNL